MKAQAWRNYRGFYEGNLRIIPLAISSAIAQALLLVPVAFLIQSLFDQILPHHQFGVMGLVAAGLLLLYILSGALAVLTRYLALRATKAAMLRLRRAVLDKMYALPRSYFDQTDLSALHTTIVHDSERVDVMSNALLALLLPAAVITLALAVVLAYIDPILFLILLLLVPPLTIAGSIIDGRMRERVRAYQRSFQDFSGGMLFVLRMMDLTRIQSAEAEETASQLEKLEGLRDRSTAMAWMQTTYMLGQNTIMAIAGVVVLLIGGVAIATGAISLGQLLSFYVILAVLRGYLGTMSTMIPQVIAGQQSLVSLDEILHLDQRLPYGGKEKWEFLGGVQLRNLTFAYDNGHAVLRDVSLEISAGSVIGLVGPNGSGKSTIMSLILGFYRPQHGEILFDGRRLDEADLGHLRSQIGVVGQVPLFFAGTIGENIAYGSANADLDSVREAAELAGAHEFIVRLPMGYDTPVGEEGQLLSGGQRQGIAIARALLRRPALLLLDEPTNHLDHEAVERILSAVTLCSSPPAVLIISHDPRAVAIAERVYRMESGTILGVMDRSLLRRLEHAQQVVGGLSPRV